MLPGGMYTTFWETNATPYYFNSNGMEIANHWGPVDVHQGKRSGCVLTEHHPQSIELRVD